MGEHAGREVHSDRAIAASGQFPAKVAGAAGDVEHRRPRRQA